MLFKSILLFVGFIFCHDLIGQDTSSVRLIIVDRLLDFGYVKPDSIRKTDVVIIHSSYCPGKDSFDLDCILQLYKKYDVSAHYIIDREGVIYKLVEEFYISHHGGKGILPDGGIKINTRSIGIELINTKASFYSEAQYHSLVALIKDIQARNIINFVLGHKNVAPARKTDPWNFDWIKFNNMMAGN